MIIAGSGAADFLTVRHLRAAGSNRAIGRAMAHAARQVHGRVAGPAPAADRTVQRARHRWFAANHPVLAERMRGIGDAFGVDAASADWDLARLTTHDVPAGCSAVFYPGAGTKCGHPLLARNFDFPTLTHSEILGGTAHPGEAALAADPWIVELYPDDGYASITIGIMDVLGAMDGINEAGLAVALLADNESPNAEPSGTPQVGLSEQQIVRYLLDTCATVDEAQQALLLAKQYYIFVPCHFLVADRTGQSFVWEYSPGHNRERIVQQSAAHERMVCTNHLLHRWPDPTELPNETTGDGTAAFTYRRWQTLHAHTADGAVVDQAEISAQLRDVRFEAPTPVTRTLWHVVYDLDDSSLQVSFFLRDDAGKSTYTEPTHFGLRTARAH
jgi:predicted choloylglycine hydrolase